MFTYKKLKSSDAGILAFEAHKEYIISEENADELGVSLLNTYYGSGSKDTFSSNLNDPLNHKRFSQLNHLFYNDPIFDLANLNNGVNYTDQEKRVYDRINVISISQKNTGNGIQKGTLTLNGTFVDDKKGNIYNELEDLDDYPKDTDRTFYLAPVQGYKYLNLNRSLKTGELLVNAPNALELEHIDDSLYTNPVLYVSCSIEELPTLNCTGIKTSTGYVKVPHSNNYNFNNDDDFTICFYYKAPTGIEGSADEARRGAYLFSKSSTQTIAGTPTFPSPQNSGSFSAQEVDAGGAFPFEIIHTQDNNILFRRSDGDNITTLSDLIAVQSLGGPPVHYAFVKTGNIIKYYRNGVYVKQTTDNTILCRNKADLFIGTRGGTRNNAGYSDGIMSQMMIFNKALSDTQILKVKESITGSPYIGNIFYEQGFITITSPKYTNATLSNTNLADLTLNFGATTVNSLGASDYVQSEGQVEKFSFPLALTFFNKESFSDAESLVDFKQNATINEFMNPAEIGGGGSTLTYGLHLNPDTGETDTSLLLAGGINILPISKIAPQQTYDRPGTLPIFSAALPARSNKDLNSNVRTAFPSGTLTNNPRRVDILGGSTALTATGSKYVNENIVKALRKNGQDMFHYLITGSDTSSMVSNLDWQSTFDDPEFKFNALTHNATTYEALSKNNGILKHGALPSDMRSLLAGEYLFDKDDPGIFTNPDFLISRVRCGWTASLGGPLINPNDPDNLERHYDVSSNNLVYVPPSPDYPYGQYVSISQVHIAGKRDRNEDLFVYLNEEQIEQILNDSDPTNDYIAEQGFFERSFDIGNGSFTVHEPKTSTYGENNVGSVLVYNRRGPRRLTYVKLGSEETNIVGMGWDQYTFATSQPGIINSAYDLYNTGLRTEAEKGHGFLKFQTSSFSMYSSEERTNTTSGGKVINHYLQYAGLNDDVGLGPLTYLNPNDSRKLAQPLSKGTETNAVDGILHITGSEPNIAFFSPNQDNQLQNGFPYGDANKKLVGVLKPLDAPFTLSSDVSGDTPLIAYRRVLIFGNETTLDSQLQSGYETSDVSMEKRSYPQLSGGADNNKHKNLLNVGVGFDATKELKAKFTSSAFGINNDGIQIQGIKEITNGCVDGNSFPKDLNTNFVPPDTFTFKLQFKVRNIYGVNDDIANRATNSSQFVSCELRKKSDSDPLNTDPDNYNSSLRFECAKFGATNFSSPRPTSVEVNDDSFTMMSWVIEVPLTEFGNGPTDIGGIDKEEFFPAIRISGLDQTNHGELLEIQDVHFGLIKATRNGKDFGYQNILEIASDEFEIPAGHFWRCYLKDIDVLASDYSEGLTKAMSIADEFGEVTGFVTSSLQISLRQYPYTQAQVTRTIFNVPAGGNRTITVPSSVCQDSTQIEQKFPDPNDTTYEWGSGSIAAAQIDSGSQPTSSLVLAYFNRNFNEGSDPLGDGNEDFVPVTKYRLFFSVTHPSYEANSSIDEENFYHTREKLYIKQGDGFSIGQISMSQFPLTDTYTVHSQSNDDTFLGDGTPGNYNPIMVTSPNSTFFGGEGIIGQLKELNNQTVLQYDNFGADVSFNLNGFLYGSYTSFDGTRNYLDPNGIANNIPPGSPFGYTHRAAVLNHDIVVASGLVGSSGFGNPNNRIPPGIMQQGTFYNKSGIEANVIGFNEFSPDSDIVYSWNDDAMRNQVSAKQNFPQEYILPDGDSPLGKIKFTRPTVLIHEWNKSKKYLDPLTPSKYESSAVGNYLYESFDRKTFLTASLTPFTASGLGSSYVQGRLTSLYVGDRRRDNYSDEPIEGYEGISNDPFGIGADNFIQVDFYKDNVKHFTRLIPGQTTLQNIMNGALEEDIDLGLINNQTEFKIEYKVVSSQDVLAPLEGKVINQNGLDLIEGISWYSSFNNTEGEGGGSVVFPQENNYYEVAYPTLRIGPVSIGSITSSNEIKRLSGPQFPQLEVSPNDSYEVHFTSPHINDGGDVGYTTGQVTASVTSVNADGTVITIDRNLFVTESLISPDYIPGDNANPYALNAVDPEGLESEDEPVGFLEIKLPLGTFKSKGRSVQEVQTEGSGLRIGNANTEDRIGFRIVDENNQILHEGNTREGFSGIDDFSTIYNDKTVLTREANTDALATLELFMTGPASAKYPDGKVSASADNVTIIIRDTNGRFSITHDTLSGSYNSSTTPSILTSTQLEANELVVSSSHINSGDHGLFSVDDFGFPIANYTLIPLQGGHQIHLSDGPLFITESSTVTGSAAAFTYFQYENPIPVSGEPTTDLVGGTFTYTDPVTGNEIEYTITNVNGNLLTLDSLNSTIDNGLIALQPSEITVNYIESVDDNFNLVFRNSHLIFENEFHCTVDENEFTHTLNASARKYKSTNHGDLADFATGSNFRPYVTTIGLYNDEGELLVVGKLAQPVRTSNETDTTFVVRYDT